MPRPNTKSSKSDTKTVTSSKRTSPTRGKESYKNPLGSVSFEGKVRLNEEQKLASQSAFLPDSVTVVTGTAGVGKSLVSMYVAFKLMKTRDIKKLVVTRPTVEAGRSLGFLPGDQDEKFSAYLAPFAEFCELLGNSGEHTFRDMVAKGQIEPALLQFLRGRNFESDTLVVLDEAQNTTVEEMLMLLTRMKEGSRLIINGDIRQKDTRGYERSGLTHLLKVAERLDYIQHHNLTINERSPRIKALVEAWDDISE